MQTAWLSYARGVAGAIVGGVAGWLLFAVLLRQGLYAPALSGAFVGLGCGWLSRTVSNALGAVCAIAGVVLALLLEWRYFPFNADSSLGYFLAHLTALGGWTQLMIVLSGVFGFWFGRGRATAAAGQTPA